MAKTPIQELSDSLYKSRFSVEQSDGFRFVALDYDETEADLKQFKEKEKQFSKLFFDAGVNHGVDIVQSIEWGDKPKTLDFEQFFCKYAEEHNE